MFWFFGHPKVYIVLTSALGAIVDIIPTFIRRPLFGKVYRGGLSLWRRLADLQRSTHTPLKSVCSIRIIALSSSIFVIIIAIIVLLHYEKERPLVKWSILTAILMVIQILSGMIVMTLRLNLLISAIHLAITIATFGSLIVTTTISFKVRGI